MTHESQMRLFRFLKKRYDIRVSMGIIEPNCYTTEDQTGMDNQTAMTEHICHKCTRLLGELLLQFPEDSEDIAVILVRERLRPFEPSNMPQESGDKKQPD